MGGLFFVNSFKLLIFKTTNKGTIKWKAFGIMGFIFGLGALGKIIMLEKQLKESGVLKEKAVSGKK